MRYETEYYAVTYLRTRRRRRCGCRCVSCSDDSPTTVKRRLALRWRAARYHHRDEQGVTIDDAGLMKVARATSAEIYVDRCSDSTLLDVYSRDKFYVVTFSVYGENRFRVHISTRWANKIRLQQEGCRFIIWR